MNGCNLSGLAERKFNTSQLAAFALAVSLGGSAASAADTMVSLRTWTHYSPAGIVKGEKIREWRLRIPQGISIGKYNSLHNPAYDPSVVGTDRGGQSLDLSLLLLDTSKNVVPYSAEKRQTHRTFAISLSNGLFDPVAPLDADFCITSDRLDDLRQFQRPQSSIVRRQCQPNHVNCKIYLSFHGWNASLFVERAGLYQNSNEACRILTRTLESWTVSIDDLRK